MRKIVTAAFVSLDGVMQAPGGPDEDRSGGFRHGGWVAGHWDEAAAAAIGETFAAPFDLLLGRKTYDIFAAYWPRIAADPAGSGVNEGTQRIATRFDEVTKYVATHRPDTLLWQNSFPLGADVVARLQKLKDEEGPTLLTQGSTELLQILLAHDLIDELRLFVFPLTLGGGKRLFGKGTRAAAFRCTASTVTPSGVLISSYERAGEVATDSFAVPETPPGRQPTPSA